MFAELGQSLAALFDQLLHWVQLHPHWATLIVFLSAALESLAIVGLFMPGALVMFGIGALVTGGALELLPTLLWAAAGAVAGDGISFWLGRHYHQALRVIWPFRRYPRLINRGMAFFHRHGGKSVLLARFVGPVRPILPAVAGMLDMAPRRFLFFNLLSALLWAPAYIVPGMVFAASLSLAAEVAGRLAVLLVLLFAALLLGVWLVRALFRLLQPRASELIRRSLAWSRRHPLIRPLAGSLLDPAHPEARGLALLAALLAGASLLFVALLEAPLTGADRLVFESLQELRTPLADRLFTAITELGDRSVLLACTLAVFGWLLLRGHRRAAWHWLAALASAAALTRLLKLVTRVERPLPLYDGLSQYAFPSSHTSVSLTLFGLLAVLIARELPPPRRWIPYALAALAFIPIAFSRLYLGAHWLSDVLGGAALGLACVALFGIAYSRHPAEPLPWRGPVLILLLTLGGVGGWHIHQTLETDLDRYRVRHHRLELPRAAWLMDGWQRLPAYRLDLADSRRHALNLQYAGSLEGLEKKLAARGWRSPPLPRWSDLLHWLVPQPAAASLPLLPQVHDGHYERLRLLKPAKGGEELLVVRLWSAHARLEDGTPLWIGNASRVTPRHLFGILTWLQTEPDFDRPLASLRRDLPTDFTAVIRHRPEAALPGWSGEVLLLSR
ncbi:VTT domain-containing protein [Thiohalobacter sp. IOR34]|uniref:bifunctional DedA family/phosphatase PAP2 family protein n=1 Tax=Thiohalobacter sp. IOR34 TaxID=3057176 RepID=UPI0025B045D9|nr:bifunctional DedA family/phosphatase PAP2 family protein [Thiohalobacter sp. IOR34]WJW75233.1 VTT domain-containing protein [Thiohalobacter sp. IOR34]